ncbi:CLUMA_CG015376, isoform A, partial [Clunio marinus]
IFLSSELWHNELLKGKTFEFKIWPLPAIEEVKTRKVGHLLNELPLPAYRRNASVELKTDSLERTVRIQDILMSENLCFNSSKSADNLFVHFGSVEYIKTIRDSSNESLIFVPLTLRDFDMTELPNNSFISLETEIDLSKLNNFSNPLIITTPSELISFISTFLEVCKSVNNAIWKNCNQTTSSMRINLAKCEIFDDLHVPESIPTTNVREMLRLLQLEPLESQMTYNIFEKFTSTTNDTNHSSEFKKIATTNYVTNVTTVYMSEQQEMISMGSLIQCERLIMIKNSSQQHHVIDAFDLNEKFPPEIKNFDFDSNGVESEIYNWQIRSELWVAIGLTVATLGILLCMAILVFIIVRICMEDVLEGNPIGSVMMLLALIAQFASFFPFTIEYVSFRQDLNSSSHAIEVFNSMCIIKIFVVSVCYCLTFSLLLSRAIMLASIGSEGGFLSHVNGYIQSIICIFSFLVQLGLSTQLLIMMHANQRHVTCENVYYGHWFWGIIAYDGILLLLLVVLSPFIFKSQRNYREGILIVITSGLCLVCWTIWIPLSMIDDNFREMMISLGVQATGWVILSSLMVPRCVLIVKSIARSDFTQALPSLTSLAFAQANHFISEPSIYECVNPTLRTRSTEDETSQTNVNEYLSPSEVPTLPLRGGGRRNLIEHYNLNFNEIVSPELPSPNKMTRF